MWLKTSNVAFCHHTPELDRNKWLVTVHCFENWWAAVMLLENVVKLVASPLLVSYSLHAEMNCEQWDAFEQPPKYNMQYFCDRAQSLLRTAPGETWPNSRCLSVHCTESLSITANMTSKTISILLSACFIHTISICAPLRKPWWEASALLPLTFNQKQPCLKWNYAVHPYVYDLIMKF